MTLRLYCKPREQKWNFLPFRPGLVGGHCIGVDPYYLTEKAIRSDFLPRMILSGREINDGMAEYIAGQIVSEMELRGFAVRSSKILIMGVTFKEDCPDLRNSKVFDMIRSLQAEGPQVEVFDPWITDSDISQKQATLIDVVLPVAGTTTLLWSRWHIHNLSDWA